MNGPHETQKSTAHLDAERQAASRPLPPIRKTLRSDTLVWIAATACLISAPVGFLSFLSLAQKELLTYSYVEILLVALTLFALQRGLPRLSNPRERFFWHALTAAFGAWLAVKLLYLVHPASLSHTAAGGRPLWAELTTEILWIGYYAAWVLALEHRAHRQDRARPAELDSYLTQPAATLFLVALAGYFWVIPLVSDLATYESLLPSMYLYLVVDLYLIARAFLLARRTRCPRWRAIYGLLGVASVLLAASDFVEYLDYRSPTWAPDVALQPVWNLGFVVLVLAARLRHRRFPAESPVSSPDDDAYRPGPGAQTLLLALIFPWIHLGFYSRGILGDGCERAREVLVTAVVLILGALALAQHRIFTRRTRALELHRRQLEAALRKSESDLRLMRQRQRSRRRLRQAAERFDSFFHFTERHRARLEARRRVAALDGLESAVCAVGLDGRALYRNSSAAELFGWAGACAPAGPLRAADLGPLRDAWPPGSRSRESPHSPYRWTAIRDLRGHLHAWLLIAAGSSATSAQSPRS